MATGLPDRHSGRARQVAPRRSALLPAALVGLVASSALAPAACRQPSNADREPSAGLGAPASERSATPEPRDGSPSAMAAGAAGALRAPEPELEAAGGGTSAASAAEPPELPSAAAGTPAVATRVQARTFVPAKLSTAELATLLEADPHTKALAHDLSYFIDPLAGIRVLGRGTNDPKGFTFSAGPLYWAPGRGRRFLIAMGRSGPDTSFLVAYRAPLDGPPELVSSYVLVGEPGPLAFGWSQTVREQVYFSTCWGCPGESGRLLVQEPDSVLIVQP